MRNVSLRKGMRFKLGGEGEMLYDHRLIQTSFFHKERGASLEYFPSTSMVISLRIAMFSDNCQCFV